MLNGTNFPLCSSLVPTVLEGQLCYKLKVNDTSAQGKRNELMLLLDYNDDRSIRTYSRKKNGDLSNKTLNFDTAVQGIQVDSAKVQINTLSPYIGFGGGIYIMTDVKRMSAKEDFLHMPSTERNCEVELYEDCRTKRLLKECRCVPLEVSGSQVGANIWYNVIILLLLLRTLKFVVELKYL